MHKTEQIILEEFKKFPASQITTTQLVRAAHIESYSSLIQDINSEDKKKSMIAKRVKAKLHRKTLHHINKLVNEGILKQTTIMARGEKTYALAIEEGEITIKKKNNQITILKQDMTTHLIQELEEKRIISKYSKENWLTKLNCIIYECRDDETTSELKEKIYNISFKVNDCIGLNGFEKILNNEDINKTTKEIFSIERTLREQNIILNLVIDLEKITKPENLIIITQKIAEQSIQHIQLCFQTNSKNIRESNDLLEKISNIFYSHQSKINLQNKDMKKAPILIGKGGTYTIDDRDWISANLKANPRPISIANISIAIDLGNFNKIGMNIKSFRQAIQKIATTLFKANIAWCKSDKQNLQNNQKDFFKYQRCYIRFWNYDSTDKKHEHFIELLESSKRDTDSFSALQRSIYNTCGLPISFRIAFSSTLNRFSSSLSERNYTKTTIRSASEYSNTNISDFIKNKEKLATIFDGGDRSRFFRKGDFSCTNFAKETAYLMSSTNLPLITFDFNETKGELKLTTFFEADKTEIG